MNKYVFGVDLGGTTVKMGLFDMDGKVLDKWEIPTVTANKGEQILPNIANSIKAKMDEKNIALDEVTGIGLGAPGPVDADGIIYKTANLGWDTVFSIPQVMRKYIDLPVMAGNDANVAALGEMWQGGGKGYKDMVMVTLGTGVGGGVIANGKMITGASGAGGEIGHIHVEDNETEQCGCHNTGCPEQYGSATGIVRLARKRLEMNEDPSALREGQLTAKLIFDSVKAGDKVAMEVADRFGSYLGKGFAAIAAVANPQAFVVGGGVSKAGEIIFEYVKPYYMKYAFHACRDAEFVLATLGNDAGIYGAAKLVLDSVK